MRKIIAAVLAALALGVAAVRFGRAADGLQDKPAREAAAAKEAPLHRGGYLNAYIALLKSDLEGRKKGFIAEGLRLSDKESALFWPIHQSYESDMKRLDDERDQLIRGYADDYGRMTDAKAKELLERRFALEAKRVDLKKTYFKRLEKVLPGKTVARFFQLEYRFRLMTDLKIISEVPLIE